MNFGVKRDTLTSIKQISSRNRVLYRTFLIYCINKHK